LLFGRLAYRATNARASSSDQRLFIARERTEVSACEAVFCSLCSRGRGSVPAGPSPRTALFASPTAPLRLGGRPLRGRGAAPLRTPSGRSIVRWATQNHSAQKLLDLLLELTCVRRAVALVHVAHDAVAIDQERRRHAGRLVATGDLM